MIKLNFFGMSTIILYIKNQNILNQTNFVFNSIKYLKNNKNQKYNLILNK